jgi:hypothetical protein
MDTLVRTHPPLRRNRGPYISPLGWRVIVEFGTLAIFLGGCVFLATALQR